MVTDIRFFEMLSPRDSGTDPMRPRIESGESAFADLLNRALDTLETPAVSRDDAADDRSASQSPPTTAAVESNPVAPVQPQQEPATSPEPARIADTTSTTPAVGAPEATPFAEAVAPRQPTAHGTVPSAPLGPSAPPASMSPPGAAETMVPPLQPATTGPQMASTPQGAIMNQADAILPPPNAPRAFAPNTADEPAPSPVNASASNTNGLPHLGSTTAMPTGLAGRGAQEAKPTISVPIATDTGTKRPAVPRKPAGTAPIAFQSSPTRETPTSATTVASQPIPRQPVPAHSVSTRPVPMEPISTQPPSIQQVSTQSAQVSEHSATSPAQTWIGNSPFESVSVPEAIAGTRTAPGAPVIIVKNTDRPLTDIVAPLPTTDEPSVETAVGTIVIPKPDMPTRATSNNPALTVGFATQMTAQAAGNGDVAVQPQATGMQLATPQLATESEIVVSAMSRGEHMVSSVEQAASARIDQTPMVEAPAMRGSPSIDTMAAAERTVRPALHPLVAQVAVHVTKAAIEGNDRISIRLSPAELGRIDVRLDFGPDGRVQAVFAADRPHTVELLQRDARELARALQDAGLQTDSGSLSFNLRNGGHGNDAAGSFERSIPGAGSKDGDVVVQVPPPQIHTYTAGTIGPGRVDIRI